MNMNMKLTRRQFLKGAAAAGVAMSLPLKFGVREAHAFYQSPDLAKFIMPLHGVHAVPPEAISVAIPDVAPAPVTGVIHYTINIQQFTDTLHNSLGPTTLWGFVPTRAIHAFPNGDPGAPAPVHLGGIIIAQKGVPIQITFRNRLTSNGSPFGIPLKGIIPVDTTLPGANQAQNRIAVHNHGGLVPWLSDGGPFDWWAPNGTHGLSFLNNVVLHPGARPNEAEYYYPNHQSARLLWYHDHAFGITRTNAYAGVASAYIIRDDFEKGLISQGLPDFIENNGNEIPIIIQDKVFVGTDIGTSDPTWVSNGLPSTPGSLWYPHVYEKNRWKVIGAGARLPNPSVIAEMFGDTMLANGQVYPEVPVEPRRYRLRILNACNARFLNLQLLVADGSPDGITIANGVVKAPVPGPDWLVLGNEAGFLQKPASVSSYIPFGFDANGVPSGSLITGNAERWDVLVDFTNFKGQDIILYTDAPAPFPFGDERNDYYFGNALNPASATQQGYGPDTRSILRFKVADAIKGNPDPDLKIDTSTDLTKGIDSALATINSDGTYSYVETPKTTRWLTLNEAFDTYGRLIQQIGTNEPKSPGKFGRALLDPVTETPSNGDVEEWWIFNLTGDTHPIHFHLVNVQILNREPFNPATFTGVKPDGYTSLGSPRPPDPTEVGWKETVRMNPGEITRVIMKFVLPTITDKNGKPVDLTSVGGGLGTPPPSPRTGGNEYVFHCHILEHEEHDMMRPLVVT
jgi:spore coat protein A, manganese oxidase